MTTRRARCPRAVLPSPSARRRDAHHVERADEERLDRESRSPRATPGCRRARRCDHRPRPSAAVHRDAQRSVARRHAHRPPRPPRRLDVAADELGTRHRARRPCAVPPSSLTSAMTTLAPAVASRRTAASPSPEAPPVTIAPTPLSSMRLCLPHRPTGCEIRPRAICGIGARSGKPGRRRFTVDPTPGGNR